MLKYRVLTAGLLLPLVVFSVYFFSTRYFAMFLGLFVVIAAWEWSALSDVASTWARLGYSGLVFAVGMLSTEANTTVLLSAVAGAMFWLGATYQLFRPQAASGLGSSRRLLLLSGVFVLVPAWSALAGLHQGFRGPTMVMILISLIWIADIGAYFVGRKWGKRKLAPTISPGKTVEGLLGGLTGVIVYASMIGHWVLGYSGWTWLLWVVLVLMTALFSVSGDLFESRLKRRVNVKDSGTILPGHGGVLDRIDSISAAAPVFFVGLHAIPVLTAQSSA